MPEIAVDPEALVFLVELLKIPVHPREGTLDRIDVAAILPDAELPDARELRRGGALGSRQNLQVAGPRVIGKAAGSGLDGHDRAFELAAGIGGGCCLPQTCRAPYADLALAAD